VRLQTGVLVTVVALGACGGETEVERSTDSQDGGSGATRAGEATGGRAGEATGGGANGQSSGGAATSSDGGSVGSSDAGGQGGEGDGISAERIGLDEAVELVSIWAYEDQPEMGPGVSFDVVEYQVPDLWETMQLQLFFAEYLSSDEGQRFNEEMFVCYEGELHAFGEALGGYGLMSAVLRGESLYYTYAWGSGIHRSQIGRLAISDGQLDFLASGGFVDVNLFVRFNGDELEVDVGTFIGFNDWEGELYGTLLEADSELVVVDASGAEIVPQL
jgi:hypothetical protein